MEKKLETEAFNTFEQKHLFSIETAIPLPKSYFEISFTFGDQTYSDISHLLPIYSKTDVNDSNFAVLHKFMTEFCSQISNNQFYSLNHLNTEDLSAITSPAKNFTDKKRRYLEKIAVDNFVYRDDMEFLHANFLPKDARAERNDNLSAIPHSGDSLHNSPANLNIQLKNTNNNLKTNVSSSNCNVQKKNNQINEPNYPKDRLFYVDKSDFGNSQCSSLQKSRVQKSKTKSHSQSQNKLKKAKKPDYLQKENHDLNIQTIKEKKTAYDSKNDTNHNKFHQKDKTKTNESVNNTHGITLNSEALKEILEQKPKEIFLEEDVISTDSLNISCNTSEKCFLYTFKNSIYFVFHEKAIRIGTSTINGLVIELIQNPYLITAETLKRVIENEICSDCLDFEEIFRTACWSVLSSTMHPRYFEEGNLGYASLSHPYQDDLKGMAQNCKSDLSFHNENENSHLSLNNSSALEETELNTHQSREHQNDIPELPCDDEEDPDVYIYASGYKILLSLDGKNLKIPYISINSMSLLNPRTPIFILLRKYYEAARNLDTNFLINKIEGQASLLNQKMLISKTMLDFFKIQDNNFKLHFEACLAAFNIVYDEQPECDIFISDKQSIEILDDFLSTLKEKHDQVIISPISKFRGFVFGVNWDDLSKSQKSETLNAAEPSMTRLDVHSTKSEKIAKFDLAHRKLRSRVQNTSDRFRAFSNSTQETNDIFTEDFIFKSVEESGFSEHSVSTRFQIPYNPLYHDDFVNIEKLCDQTENKDLKFIARSFLSHYQISTKQKIPENLADSAGQNALSGGLSDQGNSFNNIDRTKLQDFAKNPSKESFIGKNKKKLIVYGHIDSKYKDQASLSTMFQPSSLSISRCIVHNKIILEHEKYAFYKEIRDLLLGKELARIRNLYSYDKSLLVAQMREICYKTPFYYSLNHDMICYKRKYYNLNENLRGEVPLETFQYKDVININFIGGKLANDHLFFLKNNGCEYIVDVFNFNEYYELFLKKYIAIEVMKMKYVNYPVRLKCFNVEIHLILKGNVHKADQGFVYVSYLCENRLIRTEKWRHSDLLGYQVAVDRLVCLVSTLYLELREFHGISDESSTELHTKDSEEIDLNMNMGVQYYKIKSKLHEMARFYAIILLENSWGQSRFYKIFRYFLTCLLNRNANLKKVTRKLVNFVQKDKGLRRSYVLLFELLQRVRTRFYDGVFDGKKTPLFELPLKFLSYEVFIMNLCPKSIYGTQKHMTDCLNELNQEIKTFDEHFGEIRDVYLDFDRIIQIRTCPQSKNDHTLDLNKRIETTSSNCADSSFMGENRNNFHGIQTSSNNSKDDSSSQNQQPVGLSDHNFRFLKRQYLRHFQKVKKLAKKTDSRFTFTPASILLLSKTIDSIDFNKMNFKVPLITEFLKNKASYDCIHRKFNTKADQTVSALCEKYATTNVLVLCMQILESEFADLSFKNITKEQLGGNREIGIMSSELRVLQGLVEEFFKEIIKFLPNEISEEERKLEYFICQIAESLQNKVMKNDFKVQNTSINSDYLKMSKISIEKNGAAQSKQNNIISRSQKSHPNGITLFQNLDQTRWGPNFNTLTFGLLAFYISTKVKEAYLISLILFLCEFKTFENTSYCFNNNNFATGYSLLGRIGRSHMGQGTFSRSSSAYHSFVVQFILDLKREKFSRVLGPYVNYESRSFITSDDCTIMENLYICKKIKNDVQIQSLSISNQNNEELPQNQNQATFKASYSYDDQKFTDSFSKPVELQKSSFKFHKRNTWSEFDSINNWNSKISNSMTENDIKFGSLQRLADSTEEPFDSNGPSARSQQDDSFADQNSIDNRNPNRLQTESSEKLIQQKITNFSQNLDFCGDPAIANPEIHLAFKFLIDHASILPNILIFFGIKSSDYKNNYSTFLAEFNSQYLVKNLDQKFYKQPVTCAKIESNCVSKPDQNFKVKDLTPGSWEIPQDRIKTTDLQTNHMKTAQYHRNTNPNRSENLNSPNNDIFELVDPNLLIDKNLLFSDFVKQNPQIAVVHNDIKFIGSLVGKSNLEDFTEDMFIALECYKSTQGQLVSRNASLNIARMNYNLCLVNWGFNVSEFQFIQDDDIQQGLQDVVLMDSESDNDL